MEPFKAHAYIYSPFEERSGSKRLCRRAVDISWTYGYPWSQDSHYSLIPMFAAQDDPIRQHYECMSKSGPDASEMTVRAFWETIQLRDEFRQESSAFITIYFGKKQSLEALDTGVETRGDPSVLKEMQSMDWSSRETAISSCSKALQLFTNKATIQTKSEDEKENTITVSGGDTCSNANNVQSLVRKRQKLK